MRMKIKYKIIEALNEADPPKEHEKRATRIIAQYFKSDIIFNRKTNSSSPDLTVIRTNQIWELKSPLGNGKRTMANNLRDASHQSKLVIIDLSRCKMNNQNALSRINNFLDSGDSTIKKLLVIDKAKNVLEIL